MPARNDDQPTDARLGDEPASFGRIRDMKAYQTVLTKAVLLVVSMLMLACEPGAQSNVVPGGVESSGADNKLESAPKGEGASPQQETPTKPD